jgi:hypothetical protein
MNMHIAHREYKLALGHATNMLDVLKSKIPRDDFLLADAYNAIGFCMLGFKDYSQALPKLLLSLEMRQKVPDRNPAMRGIAVANVALY